MRPRSGERADRRTARQAPGRAAPPAPPMPRPARRSAAPSPSGRDRDRARRSARRRAGSRDVPARQRARRTRARSPPERAVTGRSPARRSRSLAAPPRRRSGRPRPDAPRAQMRQPPQFHHPADRSGPIHPMALRQIADASGAHPTRRFGQGCRREGSSPLRATSPASARSSVVLPAPLGPISPTSRPGVERQIDLFQRGAAAERHLQLLRRKPAHAMLRRGLEHEARGRTARRSAPSPRRASARTARAGGAARCPEASVNAAPPSALKGRSALGR